jgi:N-succinyldiaminopimelate aminotransferase
MAMTASSRAPVRGGPEQSERSPFARTAELLAPYTPAKPLITLSLGEPQHPVPGFVGPVLSQYIADFGRYPLARGIEPFRKAAATWLSRRFALPRAVDPESEVLVLNGSREGLFLRRADRRPLCRQPPRVARDPDAEPVLPGLWRRRPRGRL